MDGPDEIAAKAQQSGLGSPHPDSPTPRQTPAPRNEGYWQRFGNRWVYWSPTTGAHLVYGAIFGKWAGLQWEQGFLGFPTTDELGTPDGVGRYNHFQGGSIYWSPRTGAHEVHGLIRDHWASLGWERSHLAYPTTDESPNHGGGRVSYFEGGRISFAPWRGTRVDVRGFADTHNHQHANLGFGGKAFWGKPFGDLATELRPCNEVHGAGGTGDILGNQIRNVSLEGTVGLDIGHLVGGFPQFDGWPRWNSFTHQGVYQDWLFRAVEGGMRLMVMLAVNSESMARQVNRAEGRTERDMEAVDLQIEAAKEMEAHIDRQSGGPGTGWYRIVHTPEQAQAVISAGKLAVVLGIEVDYLFDGYEGATLTPEVLGQRLDQYYRRGVRHLFPIHFGNNAFGGASFDKRIQYVRGAPALVSDINPLFESYSYEMDVEDGRQFGYRYRYGNRNQLGLTPLGKTLIQMMIERGMIIDVDHMSAKAKADTFALCEPARYPVVSGHTGFVDISLGDNRYEDKRHEGQLTAAEFERIRALGGLVSVIPALGNLAQIKTWTSTGQTGIPHTQGYTSNTTVQGYQYAAAKMRSGPVGIGTDFNGFAGSLSPRFGPEAAKGGSNGPAVGGRVSYPFLAITNGRRMDKSVVGQKTFDINEDGLAHVGMLPDLIADFQAMGVRADELNPLIYSAQGYVDLWSRAMSSQPEWRWCNRCQGLFYGPRVNESRCPAGGRHADPAVSGSGNYRLLYEAGDRYYSKSYGWRWCNRCQGIFFGLAVAYSKCPAGATHAAPAETGSASYTIGVGEPPTSFGQAGWRQCSKCQSLFFGPHSAVSRCPAGDSHAVSPQGVSINLVFA